MTDANTGPDATETLDVNPTETGAPDAEPDVAEGDTEPQEDGQTYPAEVVRKLRDENAKARTRAREAEARAEELARALFTARVQATGKLADATDLDFNAELLDDTAGLSAAIDALTESKPHLKARRPSGSIGQGINGADDGQFSLVGRLKGNA
jgi:hypothetical protein